MKTKLVAQEKDHAREQAAAQLESITEMVKKLNSKNSDERAEAETQIQEDPLEIAIRSDWHEPGAKWEDPHDDPKYNGQFKILLCTGGPACRIIGNLKEGEPDTAQIEYQDWGTPWTEYRLTSEEEETVLTYCRCFYFGE